MSVRERAFAAVYDRLLGAAERTWLGPRREELVAPASGTVLEVGGGTGANLDHYRKAARVVVAEPSAAMRRRLGERAGASALDVTVTAASADDLPYPDGWFDTVVSTLVLCTVPDPGRALTEIRRVLRPGGELRFLEHVRGTGSVAEWQDRVRPVWSWLLVGCHPNRDTESEIAAAGFTIREVERFDSPEPIPVVRPHVVGVATS